MAYGVGDYPPKVARRLRLLNGMAYLIILFSALYAITYAAADLYKYRWFVGLNLALVVMAASVPFLHRLHELAGGVAIAVSELAALFAFTSLLGRDSGIHLNLVVGAAAPFVIFGLARRALILLVVVTSLFLHVSAWFLFPSEAASIAADQNLLRQLYVSSAVATFAVIAALVWYAFALVERSEAAMEDLLRNILPQHVADQLLAQPDASIAERAAEVCILFADIVGFVEIAAEMGPTRCVAMLNELVSAFDELAARHGVEKIKTIGDCYMAAAGLPLPKPDDADRMARFAGALPRAAAEVGARFGLALRLRGGIAAGPATAGVIGRTKFSYDVWGDTVNLAARLEQAATPGSVIVSSRFRALACLSDFEAIGIVHVRDFGEQEAWRLCCV
ncbi:MAG: adenylate/guanylate cyclase domain-containing protein [Beijerinckiaceae bacterium]|nr:adenylate/guanylate cyclase domain-containing protein [Beijerinckiaceae bacterium]